MLVIFFLIYKSYLCVLTIDEIFENSNASQIISQLRNRSIYLPNWETLFQSYEPRLHRIVNDRIGRKDKRGNKAARITLGLEKLLVQRFAEFTFAVPVKRIYHFPKDLKYGKEISASIEKVYEIAHIDSENIKRAQAYYASCEIFTLWYVVQKQTNLYGFESKYKLKCKTYSPMDGERIYPLFDEYGDLVAISFEYIKRIENETRTYFETFSADKHFLWENGLSGHTTTEWKTLISGDPIIIGKIPAAYLFRRKPVWDGLEVIREDLEYTLSRNSDVVAYNSAPILKISGSIKGVEEKGEPHRIYRVTEGGDVEYIAWQQGIEALKYHIDTLTKLYFMQAQMPDISFENLKSLGNFSYDSIKTLFTDAHLKIGQESGPWKEFLEREGNVIKAFLKQMNTVWADEVDLIQIEHVITPYIQEDESLQIDKWTKANGGKPIVSQLESIKFAGFSENAEETLQQIQKEEENEATNRTNSLTSMFSAN